MSPSAGSRAVDEEPAETEIEVVQEDEDRPRRNYLTASELAKARGVTPDAIRRRADALGAKRLPNGRMIFPMAEMTVTKTTQKTKITARSAKEEAATRAGEVASAAFDRFAQGTPLIDVVRDLRVTPETVKSLWTSWVELQKLQEATVIARCRWHGPECTGGPQPGTGMCSHHFPRARLLTDEQKMALAGQEIPVAVRCTCCGDVADKGICATCVSTVRVSARGGGLVVEIAGKIVHHVSAADARELLPLPSSPEPPSSPESAASPGPLAAPREPPQAPVATLAETLKGKPALEPEHVLRGALEDEGGVAVGLLTRAGADLTALRKALIGSLELLPSVDVDAPFSLRLSEVVRKAADEMTGQDVPMIVRHILSMSHHDREVAVLLETVGATYPKLLVAARG